MAEVLPRRFGNYRLVRPIGESGMGKTYVASALSGGSGRSCAIKVGLAGLGPEYEQRFMDEANLLAQLSSPVIASVYEVGQHEDKLFVAMEYIEGRDLGQVLLRARDRNLTVPVNTAAYIAREIARGLHDVHSQKGLSTVHRDLVPSNFVLAVSGRVKLIDLGPARCSLELEQSARALFDGHLEYAAPEKLAGRPLDARSDLFALGALLWEMVVGEKFSVHRDAALRLKTAVPRPSSRRAGIEELDDLLLRAVALEPAERFPDAQAMRTALGAWLAGRAPSPVGALVEALLDELFGDDLVQDRRQLENLLLGPPEDLAVSAEPGPAPPAGPAERFDPRLGTKIGDHYRIERLCGTGGMSRVYQASHDRTARLFAIKILRDDYRYRADVVGRFVREVQNVARLEHRNIVKIIDCGRTPDDLPFFVMEYVDGFTIRQLLDRDGRLPIELSIEIGMEVASGLKSAHQAAIVHRDLKPNNVMIVAGGDEAGSVRILDFGLSKNLEIDGVVRAPITALDVVVGSPHYMAPEQAGGGPAVLSSDVYAVGELVYEMISGVPTWDGENPGEVIHRKLKQDPTPLSRVVPEVSEDLNRVVMRALRRNPAARPSMMELAAQLAACLDPAAGPPGGGSELAGPVQQPPGLWPAHEAARCAGVGTMTFVSRRSAETHPVLVAVGGLLLFAAGVGSVIWSRSTGPAQPGREAVPVGSRSLPVEPARAEEPLPELPVSPGPPELLLPHRDADQDRAYRAITRHEPRRATRSRTHRPSRSRRELVEKPIRAPEQEESAALPSSESPRLVMDATEAFGRRDYGLALSKAQEALAAAGNRSFDAHMILARTYFILDRFRAAEEHFRAAVLLRPADGRALRGLASAAARTRN